ncbi:MAG: hypothetical protein HYS12_02545 [Planctomycetes bacterium]|nr:hypothetical protein [Planctomycetota bacterium]
MRNFCKASLSLALVVMLASPALAQRQRQRPGGGFGGGNLLTNKSVQDELKITKEQKEKIDEASKKIQEKMQKAREEFRDLKQEERQAKFQALQKETTEELTKAADLTSEQKKRFGQIQLQQLRTRAFTNADVQKQLKLTDEQKETIKTALKEGEDKIQEETKGLDRRTDGQKIREIRQKVGKATQGKIAASLTSEQKKTWADMVGEPFEVKFEQRRPGGGNRRPRNNQQLL